MQWKIRIQTLINIAIKSKIRVNYIIIDILCCINYSINGFIKKTQKTPAKEIELARKRMIEVKKDD